MALNPFGIAGTGSPPFEPHRVRASADAKPPMAPVLGQLFADPGSVPTQKFSDFADPHSVPQNNPPTIPPGGFREKPWERFRNRMLNQDWFVNGDSPPQYLINLLFKRPAMLRAIQRTPELLEVFKAYLPSVNSGPTF